MQKQCRGYVLVALMVLGGCEAPGEKSSLTQGQPGRVVEVCKDCLDKVGADAKRGAVEYEPGFRVDFLSPEHGKTNVAAPALPIIYAVQRRDGKSDYKDIEQAFSMTDLTTSNPLSGTFSYGLAGEAGAMYMKITFTPTGQLASGHEFLAKVISHGDVHPGLSGKPADVQTRFRTGSMPRVRAVRFVPKGQAGSIAYIEVSFSEPMETSTLGSATAIFDAKAQPAGVSGKSVMGSDGLVAHLSPASPSGDQMKVVVSKDARASTGLALDGEYIASPGKDFSITATPSKLPVRNGGYEWRPW